MATADQILAGAGKWGLVVIALVLLLEAIPLVGAFIPAQLFLLGAGFVASQNETRAARLEALSGVILVASVSLFLADIVSFWLGRRYGTHVLDRLPGTLARRARGIRDGLAGHAGKTLVLGKFLGPARALGPPLAGAARVGWPRFLAFEAIGSAFWVLVITCLGYLFGRQYARLERALGRSAILLVLVLVVVYLTIMRFRSARREEALESREAPPPRVP